MINFAEVTKLLGNAPWMTDHKAKFQTIDEAAKTFLNLGSLIAALIAVSVLIYGGITYILSSGDSSKTEKAQNTIIYALVGLVIVGIAYLIVGFVLRILGMNAGPIDQ